MLTLQLALASSPLVADAVEPGGQYVEQKAPDALLGRERHYAVPRLPVAAIVLVAEGHAAFVEADEPADRDGDAWVSRER
jgi:hypothetical protein